MAMETTGNPSSVHAEGRAARRIVEDARSEVARLAGVAPAASPSCPAAPRRANAALNPLFGGGPERGAARAAHRLRRRARLRACRGIGFPRRRSAPLLPDGRVDLDWLEAACRRPGRVLLALQGANNETGVIQPVARSGGAGPCRGRLSVLRRGADGRADGLRHRARSAPTRSCCRRTRWAASRARARWSRRAPGSASARRSCAAAARSAARARAPKPSRRSRLSARRRARASPSSRRSRRGSWRCAIA